MENRTHAKRRFRSVNERVRRVIASQPQLHEQLSQLLDSSNQRFFRRLDRKRYFQRKIAAFRNLHEGETCFVVGNGPSLNSADLSLISKYPSFASNRIFEVFDSGPWRPTYYVTQDIYDERLATFVKSAALGKMFVGSYFWKRWGLADDAAAIAYNGRKSQKNRGFSLDCDQWVGEFATVTFTSLQLAAFMGFKRIVLLGVDHAYSRTVGANGQVHKSDDRKDHFYSKGSVPDSLANIEQMEASYRLARETCSARNIAVLDATRGGALTVFPKVQLEDVV